MGITRKDRMRNVEIRSRTGTWDITTVIRKLKIEYAGHLVRNKNEERWGKKATIWVPYDKKRKRVRPALRWEHDIVQRVGI